MEMEAGTRPKTYFDSKTRRIRRASSQITRLCRFEQDSEKFVDIENIKIQKYKPLLNPK